MRYTIVLDIRVNKYDKNKLIHTCFLLKDDFSSTSVTKDKLDDIYDYLSRTIKEDTDFKLFMEHRDKNKVDE